MSREEIKEALKTLTSEDISGGVLDTVSFFKQMEYDPEQQLYFVFCESSSINYKVFDAIAAYAAENANAEYEILKNLFPNDQTVVRQLKISKKETDLCCLLKMIYASGGRPFCWNKEMFIITKALAHRGTIDSETEEVISEMLKCGFSSEEELHLFWEKMDLSYAITREQLEYSPEEYTTGKDKYRSAIETIKKIVRGKDNSKTVNDVIDGLTQTSNLSEDASIEELILAKRNDDLYKKVIFMAEENDASSITKLFESLCDSENYKEIDIRHFIDSILDGEEFLDLIFDSILASKRVLDVIFEKKFLYYSNRWLIIHALCGQDNSLKDDMQERIQTFLDSNVGKKDCDPNSVIDKLYSALIRKVNKWKENENASIFWYSEDDVSDYSLRQRGKYSEYFLKKMEWLKKYYLAIGELGSQYGIELTRSKRDLEIYYDQDNFDIEKYRDNNNSRLEAFKRMQMKRKQ